MAKERARDASTEATAKKKSSKDKVKKSSKHKDAKLKKDKSKKLEKQVPKEVLDSLPNPEASVAKEESNGVVQEAAMPDVPIPIPEVRKRRMW
jgi:hypothetical protein